MSENMIHLIVTPMQANGIAICVKLVKEMLSIAPGVAVFPNPFGDMPMERDLMKAEIGGLQETLFKQLEEHMPKE